MHCDRVIPGRRHRMLTRAKPVLAGACVIICLFSAAAIAGVIVSAARAGRVFDFAQEWTSARNFLVGLPVYLDFGKSLAIHLGGSASPTFAFNAHPPGAVLLAVPFGLLEYPAAYLLWSVLSLTGFAFSLWLLTRARPLQQSGLAELCLLALVVSGSSLTHQMIQGQLNLVLLALITGAWSADRRNCATAGGALIGMAAAIKIFPAFLILYFLAQKKWRAVGAGAAAFLAVNGVGCLLFGVQAYRDYFLRVAPDVAKFRDTWPNASLLGYWSKLFDGAHGHVIPLWHFPLLAKTMTAISCLVLVATTVWAVAKIRHSAGKTPAVGPDRDMAFGLCCAGMLLASPITWDHAFLLLIPAFWFAWHACHGQNIFRTLLLAMAIFLLWLNPMSVWTALIPDQFGTNGRVRLAEPASVLTLVSFQFYALLVFYLLVLAKLRQQQAIVNQAFRMP